MKPAKEYSILPQCERDGGYIIRPENDPVKKKSCVLISFVILAVLIIISGALALVIGLFYSQEFTTTINTYWKPNSHQGLTNLSSGNRTVTDNTLELPEGVLKNPVVQNDTVTISNPKTTETPENESSSEKSSSVTENTDTDAVDQTTGADMDSDESAPTTQKPTTNADAETDSEEEDESKEEDEDTDDDLNMDKIQSSTTTTDAPTKPSTSPPAEHSTKKHTKPHSTKHNSTKQALDRQEEFAETMQEMEKYFESVTGIRRAEFVIPLMMLLVFVVAVFLSSCCCYLILKRKDKQRRKVLGKMITDLQAGDKGNLLDQDGDD